ncbi:MAG: hydroxysqualene dehydroxylase HpnE, partial [Chloroflexi bacterium]|nr:hydroxysqualene dehydroxylase HpnE [Chloroflexota bacterium]
MDSELHPDGARSHCVVIGGGLAGLSAACALAERGITVTLIERRNYLGGRAFSFIDPQTGMELDNGQHVFLRCCTEYIDFLNKIEAFAQTTLQERLHVTVADRDGKRGSLSSTRFLPAPLDVLPSLLLYRHLGPMNRIRVVRGMMSIRRTDRERERERLESMSFRDWLLQHGQNNRTISALWELITLPILNDTIDAVSAYMGIMAFQDSLLAGKGMADLGYSRVGLSTLVSDGARQYIESRGGRLIMGRRVSDLRIENGRVTGVKVGEETISADAVISALPWDGLERLVISEDTDSPLSSVNPPQLEWAPIVGLHIGYDRPVMEEPFLTVVDSPIQWIFNRSLMQESADEHSRVLVSISAAWREAGMTEDELRDMAEAELHAVLPETTTSSMTYFRVVKQPQATFRCLPGTQDQRPPQSTTIPGLFLA